MFWISRVFELLSATKKLNASKAYLMNVVSGLVVVMLLGVFGTFLFALMTGLLLWLTYTQMLIAGAGVLWACLGTAALTFIILSIAATIATRIFGQVREGVELIFRSQSPIVAPVVDRVTNVASSFLNGLRTSHGVQPGHKKR
ncbi:hypothetical protein MMA231_00613 [Asticcacaulis sp. MM231]|uniref:hypothetical protein n=1 Tax=Asticcacaulis sp. MM231 TaxID=3157666 RepID=UPI0032D5ACAB